MLNLLYNHGYSHIVLYHQIQDDAAEQLVSQMQFPTASSNPVNVCMDLPVDEASEITKFASEHRNLLHVHPSQDLMIGVAWATPPEKRLFRQFPEVLFIDTTQDTDKENRPLLLVTGLTSDGSVYTALRVFFTK